MLSGYKVNITACNAKPVITYKLALFKNCWVITGILAVEEEWCGRG
jgi:hypothetical protein